MSIDKPTELPLPADAPRQSDAVNDPIGEQALWDRGDGVKGLHAESLSAIRQEQADLRAQGNDDAAAALDAVPIRAEALDGLPGDVRERLTPDDIDGMTWPVIYERGPAPQDESYIAYNRHDWSASDARDPNGRRAPEYVSADQRQIRWASPASSAADDHVLYAVHESQKRAQDLRVPAPTVADVLGPGAVNAGADLAESRALTPDFTPTIDRLEARNAQYTLDLPAGTQREVIRSVVASQDSAIDRRSGAAAYTGGGEQALLLSYDTSSAQLTAHPIGESIALDPYNTSQDRYSYPDRP